MDTALAVWPPGDVSPDGRTLFYSIRDGEGTGKKIRLMRRDLNTGTEKLMHEAELGGVGFFAIAVSPDGFRVAFMANTGNDARTVYVMPTDGGAPREIYRGSYEDPSPMTSAWTKDGRHLIIVRGDSASKNSQWKAIPMDGGEPVIVDPGMRFERLEAPTFSPDGHRLAFGGGTTSAELWVLKNLVSNVQAAK
jgi:Tol biopolymer transport system component